MRDEDKTREQLMTELAEMRRRISEVEKEIDTRIVFTRALVHELKTRITPVLFSSDWLLEEAKEETLRSLAQNIYRGASNLNRRIDELLDLARSEIDMLQVNPKPVDPIPLLQDIAAEMVPVAKHKEQSLRLEIPSSLPNIWVDEDRIRQVILNLLDNAFKFTHRAGKITLRAKKDKTNLVVEVQDTGPGISKEKQQGLFDSYVRLGSDRTHVGGLGIGLALSKRLVELYGGQIWVKSQKGSGSIFAFSVPFATASQREKSNQT